MCSQFPTLFVTQWSTAHLHQHAAKHTRDQQAEKNLDASIS